MANLFWMVAGVLRDEASKVAAWVHIPSAPCSVDQVRVRLMRSLMGTTIIFFILRLLCNVLFYVATSTDKGMAGLGHLTKLDGASLVVAYLMFYLVDRHHFCASTMGTIVICAFLANQCLATFVLQRPFYNPSTFAAVVTPIMCTFMCSKKTWVLQMITITVVLLYSFFNSIDQPVKPISTDDIQGIFTIIAAVFSVSLHALIYVAQAQQNYHALASIAEQMDQINLTKTLFIANLSHELRTPLHAILAASSFAKSEDMSSDLRSFLNTIESSGNIIKGLVGNIIDLARVDTDMFEWNCQIFDVASMVEEVIGTLSVLAHNKSIDLRLSMPMRPPFPWQFIYSDNLRLKKVLLNLTDNAVKYCNSGHVQVNVVPVGYFFNDNVPSDRELAPNNSMKPPFQTIHELLPFIQKEDFVYMGVAKHKILTEKQQPYAVKLRFEVIDTGIGIAKEFLADIFEPFSKPLRLKEGPGLGLCVSQRLVRGLGGVIKAESEVNEGSRFWFDLIVPVTECKLPQTEIKMPLAEGDGALSSAILVPRADPTPTLLTLLEDIQSHTTIRNIYFYDQQNANGANVLEQLTFFGFNTVLKTAEEIVDIFSQHAQSALTEQQPQQQSDESLDLIVMDDALALLEQVLPYFQNDLRGLCPTILYLCEVGREEVLSHVLPLEDKRHTFMVTKPIGPIKLLMSLQKIIHDVSVRAGRARRRRPRTESGSSVRSSVRPYQDPAVDSAMYSMESERCSPPSAYTSSPPASVQALTRSASHSPASISPSLSSLPSPSPFGDPASIFEVESPSSPPPSHEGSSYMTAHGGEKEGTGHAQAEDEEDEEEDTLDLAALSSKLLQDRLLARVLSPTVADDRRLSELSWGSDVSDMDSVGETTPPPRLQPILVVEDNPINQMILKHLLTNKMKLECEIAENGRKALEAWSERDFSMIFMDIQMPVMDGITAIREIRRLEVLENRKRSWIVAMTGLAFVEDRGSAISAGCDEFLAKPVDMEMLQRRITMWLSNPATMVSRPPSEADISTTTASSISSMTMSSPVLTSTLARLKAGGSAGPVQLPQDAPCSLFFGGGSGGSCPSLRPSPPSPAAVSLSSSSSGCPGES